MQTTSFLLLPSTASFGMRSSYVEFHFPSLAVVVSSLALPASHVFDINDWKTRMADLQGIMSCSTARVLGTAALEMLMTTGRPSKGPTKPSDGSFLTF